jgi:hypothetical protein
MVSLKAYIKYEPQSGITLLGVLAQWLIPRDVRTGLFDRRLKRIERLTAMECRCGNTMGNVPEHLRDLATWICQKCTNTAPKAEQSIEQAEEPLRKRMVGRRRKEAA